MKFRKLNVRIGVCLSTLFLLSACGGGGGGGGTVSSGIAPSTPPVIVPTVLTPYTQAEAKQVATIGFQTVEILTTKIDLQQFFFASFLQLYSNNPAAGSVSPTAITCDQPSAGTTVPGVGTFSIATSKAGSYQGLRLNDTITFNFSGCVFRNGTTRYDGQATVTALGTIELLPASPSVAYRLNTTNYSTASLPAGTKDVSNGTLTVTYDGTANGLLYADLLATSNGSYSLGAYLTPTALSPALTYSLGLASSVGYGLTPPFGYSASLNGPITVASSAGPVPLRFLTTTPLTGTIANATFRQTPTAGVLSTTDTARNLLTRTTISGTGVTVNFDSNRDSVTDAVFTDAYSNLNP